MVSHNFSQVPQANIQRSVFDRTSTHKTTINGGYLVPVWADEYLPGDTFNEKVRVFARLSTSVTPFIDNLKASLFFFAVPNRLIWEHWQNFCGERDNPDDSTDYLVPQVVMPSSKVVTVGDSQVEIGGCPPESLFNYFGVPMFVPNLKVNALHSRAYNLIYNEWFRDENLQQSVPVDTGDGPDNYSDYVLLRRGKRHDYFTSALPWPQKGPGVEIPLGVSAPVHSRQTNLVGVNDLTYPVFYQSSGVAYTPGNPFALGVNTGGGLVSSGTPIQGSNPAYMSLYADLSSATAATINSLRQAFQIQRLYETDARGGTRYTEILRAHFGVVSPDARLQRPEYLGGSTQYVDVLPVTQTASTDGVSPQGNLTSNGILSMEASFTKSFVEHGVLLCLLHIGADLTYQSGLPRMFSRRTRFDFYWPTLAHLGEQGVFCKEIYAQGVDNNGNPKTTTVNNVVYDDDSVFGYQERFAEYRYKESLITGRLNSRSRDAKGNVNTLDVWHLAQDFASLPTLSPAFIVDNPPINRVKAVQDEPDFIVDVLSKCRCVRPMPVYSVPGFIDHF